MATVWITQETAHDIRKAEAFGDVRFVTGQDFLSIAKSQRNEALLLDLRMAATLVDPADWIVQIGSPYVSTVFCAYVAKRLGVLRLLRWSNRDNEYFPLELPL